LTENLENNFEGYFIIASQNEKVVAWTYFFIDGCFGFNGLISGVFEKLYRLFPLKFKTAFISSPVAEYNAFHIRQDCKNQKNALIEKMMAEAFVFFRARRIKMVVIKDHIAKYRQLHKNFTHLHFMPGTFLDFDCVHDSCNCFEEYLMSLKKKWRANIRNKIKRRKEDLAIEVVSGISEADCVRCHELYCQTRNKQRLKHENLSADYFCACGNELGDSCKMLIAKAGGEIIGFAQLLENEDDVINVRMGMDYRFNKEYNLYHHLLYENIAYCLQNKKKRLYTSQTCYRPKLELGAKLMPLHTYVYFQNPILHKIFGKILAKNCECYSELIEADRPSEVLAKYTNSM
jgi:predicted N-acyltransferase